MNNLEMRSEVCGDGFSIDDAPPVPGTVAISNTQSGYLGNEEHVMVTWTGFSDGGLLEAPSGEHLLNYSVALGESSFFSFFYSQLMTHNISIKKDKKKRGQNTHKNQRKSFFPN